jgi:hypothetical protein
MPLAAQPTDQLGQKHGHESLETKGDTKKFHFSAGLFGAWRFRISEMRRSACQTVNGDGEQRFEKSNETR